MSSTATILEQLIKIAAVYLKTFNAAFVLAIGKGMLTSYHQHTLNQRCCKCEGSFDNFDIGFWPSIENPKNI